MSFNRERHTQAAAAKRNTNPEATDEASVWDGIEDAEVTTRNPYLGPGEHTLKIERIELFTSQEGIEFFLVEFEVVETDNPAMKVGQLVTWMMKTLYKGKPDMFLGNVKPFLAAAAGCDISEIKAAHGKRAAGKDQPLTGEVVQCYGTERQTKDKEGTYSAFQWYSVEDGGQA